MYVNDIYSRQVSCEATAPFRNNSVLCLPLDSSFLTHFPPAQAFYSLPFSNFIKFITYLRDKWGGERICWEPETQSMSPMRVAGAQP